METVPVRTKNNMCYRSFEFQVREAQIENSDSKELWVEGFAVRFNSPTVLFEMGGIEYKEQIDSRAFED